MAKSDAQLQSAIEGLYRTFSRYPLPGQMDGSPFSVSDADQALLRSKDLRDLGPDELAHYSLDALTMWGWTDDFRHFLPRIFERLQRSAAAGPFPKTFLESSLTGIGRLGRATNGRRSRLSSRRYGRTSSITFRMCSLRRNACSASSRPATT